MAKTYRAKELRTIYKDVVYNWPRNSDSMVIFENAEGDHTIKIYKSDGEAMLGVYEYDELKLTVDIRNYEIFVDKFSRIVGGIIKRKEIVYV